MLIKKTIAFLLIPQILFSGCAANTAGVSSAGSSSSLSQEFKVGQQIHDTIMASFHTYTEPTVVEYVNRVGQQLASSAARQELKYQFTILYHEKIYATSAPGGHVYVTTGLLYFLDNEAELAAAIAHEIGQLQQPDIRLSDYQSGFQKLTQGAAMVGPAFGQIGMLAVLGLVLVNKAMESARPSLEKRLKRADQKAFQYMVDAGYDPQGLLDLQFKFLNADQALHTFFSDYYESRPITPERFENLQIEFSQLPLEGRTFTTNRDMYEQMTKGIGQIYQG